ncbi:MAG TPA: hypothetical protein VGI17_11435 [Solirubrobacterales bacterium]
MATVAAALLMSLGASNARADPVGGVERFPTKCGVGQLVAGPDGNVWFTCFRDKPGGKGQAMIGRVTPAGDVTEFALPPRIGAGDLAAGPDGNLWFTYSAGGFGPPVPGYSSAIGRITPTGDVTVFRTGLRTSSRPGEIIAGPDGNLWFVDAGTSAQIPGGSLPEVGRITPQGTITEFATGVKPPLGLGGLAADPTGNVWFTQVFDLPHNNGEPGGLAGRVSPSGEVALVGDAPAAFAAPVAGPDGDVWFTDATGHTAIDRVTPSGELAKFSQGLLGVPTHLVAGPDGNLWFTAQQTIGRVTPSGEITTFTKCLDYRMTFSEAASIVSGPGGDLWFTSVTSRMLPSMGEAPTIGRVTPSGEITLFKAGIQSEPGSIVAGPDGRVWFTAGGEGIDRITPPDAPVNTFILTPGEVSTSGIARLPVEVPGPGLIKARRVVLLLPHKRTARLPGAASLHAAPAACGPASLRLRLRGPALSRLRREGSIRVRVTATFTPTGGTPNTRTEVTVLRGHRVRHRSPVRKNAHR